MEARKLRHKALGPRSGEARLLTPTTVIEVSPAPGALEAARDRVRSLISAGLPEGGVLVSLRGGEYELSEPLRFGPADAGRENAPVIWRSAPGERAILSGGKKLPRELFRPVEKDDPFRARFPKPEAVLYAELGAVGVTLPPMTNGYGMAYAGEENVFNTHRPMTAWPELYQGETLLTVARYPKSGWLRTVRCPEDRETAPGIYPFGCDDAGLWRIRDFSGCAYHGYPYVDWAFAAAPLGKIDRAARTLETAQKLKGGFRNDRRFYLSRVPEALSEPGEYVPVPETNRLYLIPSENGEDLRVSCLRGAILEITDARDLYFENLTFAYAAGSGAVVTGGENVRFCGCRFANLGFHALRFGCQESTAEHECDTVGKGGKNHRVLSCDVDGCGFGGIYISAGNRETLAGCGITVENCDVRNFSRTGKCYCFGVCITAVGVTVRRNRFHDGAHSAIWFDGNDNVIELNEFYDLLRESDDAACVYCGRDYTTAGNVIRHNFFHDMSSDASTDVSIFGTYCDDNSCSLAVYGNLYYHMQGAHHSHGGHDLVIENNLVVDGTPNSVRSITFARYCFPDSLKAGGIHRRLWDRSPAESPLWRMRWPHQREYLTWDPDTEGRYPHYCSYRGNVLIRHLPIEPNFAWDTPGWGNVMENNVTADVDPGFADEETLDLRLRPDSPVYSLVPGFPPIPYEEIGIYRDVYREEEND